MSGWFHPAWPGTHPESAPGSVSPLPQPRGGQNRKSTFCIFSVGSFPARASDLHLLSESHQPHMPGVLYWPGFCRTQKDLNFFLPILFAIICRFSGEGNGTLAWKIPWMEEPGGLQSMGSRRGGHDWATPLSLFTFMHWRRKWQPTPVFLPGEPQGRGSLVGCRLWGRTESDTTEATQQQ